MNVLEYIKSQIVIWGEEYVDDLMERGYTPVLTTRGYKWVHNSAILIDSAAWVSANDTNRG